MVPPKAAQMDLGELTVALTRSGYSRGLLTSMYGERLQALMKAIASGSLDCIIQHLAAGDRASFVGALQEVFGIGPKVAAQAWNILSGSAQK
jgi:hypothetical protein